MKIRNGFVSNSSSSSFVVAFPSVPSNAMEVQTMLFGDIKYVNVYGDDISTKQMARIIFEDMKENGFASEKKIVESVAGGWYPGCPDYDYDWRDEKASEEYSEKFDKGAEKLAKKFMSANEGAYFFVFRYSDNDGPLYSTMEHGGIFNKLPNLTISEH